MLEQQEKVAEVAFCLSIFMYSEQGAVATAGSVGFMHKPECVVHAAEGTAVLQLPGCLEGWGGGDLKLKCLCVHASGM